MPLPPIQQGLDFSKPIFGRGIVTNAPPAKEEEEEKGGIDFSKPVLGEGIITNAPTRQQMIQQPRKEPREEAPRREPAPEPEAPDAVSVNDLEKFYGITKTDKPREKFPDGVGSWEVPIPYRIKKGKEGEEEFLAEAFPHPNERRVSGMDYDDQRTIWWNISPEGRRHYSEWKQDKFWDSGERKWVSAKEPMALAVKMKGMKGYRDIGTWEKVRGSGVGEILWGLPDTNVKAWDDRSGFERHGIMGLMPDMLVLQATGLDTKIQKEMMEDMRSHGIAGVTSYKGYQYGSPLGMRGKLIGAIAGYSLGYTASELGLRGKITPAGKQIEAGFYGSLLPDRLVGPFAKNFVRRILAGGMEGFAVSETAQQAQSIIDERKVLPQDPRSLIERNLALFALNGGLRGLQGKGYLKGKPDKKQTAILINDQVKGLNDDAQRLIAQRINRMQKSADQLSSQIKKDQGISGVKWTQDQKSKLGSWETEIGWLKSKLDKAKAGKSIVDGIDDEIRISQVLAAESRKPKYLADLDGLIYDTSPAVQKAVVTKAAVPGKETPELDIVRRQTDHTTPHEVPTGEDYMSLWDKFATSQLTQYRVLTALQRKMGEIYGEVKGAEPVEWVFEMLPKSYNKGARKVLAFDRDVSEKIHSANLWDEFNQYAFLQRVGSRLRSGDWRATQLKIIDDEIRDAAKKGYSKKEIAELGKVKKKLKSMSDKRVFAFADESGEVM